MSGWTNTEHVDALRTLWLTGASHSKIAAEINRRFAGAAYSRDSVCGKAVRLKLPPRPADDPRRAQAMLKIAGRGTVFEEAETQAPRVELRPEAFAPLSGVQPIPFIDRNWSHCAWPVGGEGAEMLCCGAQRDGEGPYCGAHRQRATQAVRPGNPRNGNELARSLRRFA